MPFRTSLDILAKQYVNCDMCPLSELRTQVVFGSGNHHAQLAIISEAPGEEEDKQGTPFVGCAGEMLDRILESVGIKRCNIWITNTCLCRPKSDVPGKANRKPLLNEIRACNQRLIDEIAIIGPSMLVLAGATPLYMATRKRAITKNRGWQEIKWQGTIPMYATLHPASLLYGSPEQKKLKADWIYEDWRNIAEALSVKKEEETSQI